MAEVNATRRHTNFKDLSGMKFGRWTVLQEAPRANGRIRWLCRCECGRESVVRANHLQSGASRGCNPCGQSAHGMSNTSEYIIWQLMHQRCKNPTHKSRHRYGGRGIRVCDRWRSFEAFYADMGPRPSTKHSIDRIDNDGDYCPENCRWATKKQQQRNRVGNHLVTLNGETRCVAEWSEVLGISLGTVRSRLDRGWNAERALTTPVK